MTTMTMQVGETYDLHFDESKFGSGHRSIMVMKVGRKWITGMDPSTLTVGKIALLNWELSKPRLMKTTPRQQAARIKGQRDLFKRLDIKFARMAIKRFLTDLKGV